MRLIIAGSRTFSNYTFLKWKVSQFLNGDNGIEIVSGCAYGADRLGERFAEENGYPVKMFPAQWREHGRSAGMIRNEQMAEYATHCICFWNGVSNGTKNMIEVAQKFGLETKVVLFYDENS